jgi:hypothetical protein
VPDGLDGAAGNSRFTRVIRLCGPDGGPLKHSGQFYKKRKLPISRFGGELSGLSIVSEDGDGQRRVQTGRCLGEQGARVRVHATGRSSVAEIPMTSPGRGCGAMAGHIHRSCCERVPEWIPGGPGAEWAAGHGGVPLKKWWNGAGNAAGEGKTGMMLMFKLFIFNIL